MKQLIKLVTFILLLPAASFATDLYDIFLYGAGDCNPRFSRGANLDEVQYKMSIAQKNFQDLKSSNLSKERKSEILEQFKSYLSEPYIAINAASTMKDDYKFIINNLGEDLAGEFQEIFAGFSKQIDESAASLPESELFNAIEAKELYFDLSYDLYVVDMRAKSLHRYENEGDTFVDGFMSFAYKTITADLPIEGLRNYLLSSVPGYNGYLGHVYAKESLGIVELYGYFFEGMSRIMVNEFLADKSDFYFRMSYKKYIDEFRNVLKLEKDIGYTAQRLARFNKQLNDLEEETFQRFLKNNPELERASLYEREGSALSEMKKKVDRYEAFIDINPSNTMSENAGYIDEYFDSLYRENTNLVDEITNLFYKIKSERQTLSMPKWSDNGASEALKPRLKSGVLRNLQEARKMAKSDSKVLKEQANYIVNFINQNFIR